MDAAPTLLDTARLHLQPLRPCDAPALFPLFHDPGAMPYWHTLPHASVDDTRATIESMLRPPHARWWTLRTAADPARAIGFLGFLGYAGIPGFGYAVHADHRSQGYVREAARAALDEGFRQLRLDRVELWIHEANLPSRRVAESLGFVRRGCFRQMYPREGRSRETWVYGATPARWCAGRAHGGPVPMAAGWASGSSCASAAIFTITSDRLSPLPHARTRASSTSTSVAFRGGKPSTTDASSACVK
ncbi:N-acetyltransferase [Verminephrobacter aporrectodeae subsp. tuberculatae]|nr:N-acetyltransferase [Verminephrobacter aporrectodeae subsp. tuberculatae]MCW8208036.1 N-acetyltransferase [Verminephrobacter aporrectodeae subsp. tuberculatae]